MDHTHESSAAMHAALFQFHRHPTMVADHTGVVRAWNRAAERCTGLSSERVIGRPLWEVEASVAPATVPYEQALESARRRFHALVAGHHTGDDGWTHRSRGAILSTSGTLHFVRTEVFPIQVGERIMIVAELSDSPAADPEPAEGFSHPVRP